MNLKKHVEHFKKIRKRVVFWIDKVWTKYDKTRVEAQWLSCKNLQVSGRNLQGDASPCKFFFQKLASSCKLTIRLASSCNLTIRLASSYKLTIRLTRHLQVNHSNTHTHTHHARTYTGTHTHTRTHTHAHTHTYTHAQTHTHTHTYVLKRK